MPRRRTRASKRIKKVISEEKKILRTARAFIGPLPRPRQRSVLPRDAGLMGGSPKVIVPKGEQVAAMITSAVNLERWYEQKEYRNGRTRGLTLYGQLPIGYLVNAGTGPAPSGAFSLWDAPTAGTFGIGVNPNLLFPSASPERKVGNSYAKFQFTKIRLHFVTQAGANITGSAWSSYLGDAGTVATGFDSAQEVGMYSGAAQIPIWTAHAVTDFSRNLSDKDWFYTTLNSGSDNSLFRQADQGLCLFAWQSVPSINFGSGGYILNLPVVTIFLEYSVNFIDPMITQASVVPPSPEITGGLIVTARPKVRREVSDRDRKVEVVPRPEPERAQAQEPSMQEIAAEALRSLGDRDFDELYSRLKLERKLSAIKPGPLRGIGLEP